MRWAALCLLLAGCAASGPYEDTSDETLTLLVVNQSFRDVTVYYIFAVGVPGARLMDCTATRMCQSRLNAPLARLTRDRGGIVLGVRFLADPSRSIRRYFELPLASTDKGVRLTINNLLSTSSVTPMT